MGRSVLPGHGCGVDAAGRRHAAAAGAAPPVRSALILFGVSSYILISALLWVAGKETRDEAHENRSRIVALEEAFVKIDATGSAALRRHVETPVGRAHPVSESIACPYCPPCK